MPRGLVSSGRRAFVSPPFICSCSLYRRLRWASSSTSPCATKFSPILTKGSSRKATRFSAFSPTRGGSGSPKSWRRRLERRRADLRASKPGRQAAGGNLSAPVAAGPHAGWIELKEAEADKSPEEKPEVLRALVATPLADGSTLIVGDEQLRADTALGGILSAFAWAVGATIALGVARGSLAQRPIPAPRRCDEARSPRHHGRRLEPPHPADRGQRRPVRAGAHVQPTRLTELSNSCWPTSTSARTSRTTCASRSLTSCAAWKRPD